MQEACQLFQTAGSLPLLQKKKRITLPVHLLTTFSKWKFTIGPPLSLPMYNSMQ